MSEGHQPLSHNYYTLLMSKLNFMGVRSPISTRDGSRKERAISRAVPTATLFRFYTFGV